MVGHLVLQTLSILASLITLGLCNIGTSVPVAVDVYKGTQTAQFLGDRLIAVKWVGQGPEFKWVGAGDTKTYEFRVQDYGVKDDIVWTYYTAFKSLHSNWQAFNINVMHIKTDMRNGRLFITVV